MERFAQKAKRSDCVTEGMFEMNGKQRLELIWIGKHERPLVKFIRSREPLKMAQRTLTK